MSTSISKSSRTISTSARVHGCHWSTPPHHTSDHCSWEIYAPASWATTYNVTKKLKPVLGNHLENHPPPHHQDSEPGPPSSIRLSVLCGCKSSWGAMRIMCWNFTAFHPLLTLSFRSLWYGRQPGTAEDVKRWSLNSTWRTYASLYGIVVGWNSRLLCEKCSFCVYLIYFRF